MLKVARTPENHRKRPNAETRHDPLGKDEDLPRRNSRIFLHDTDLEWLSLNWRKYRAAQLSSSNRRMILYMFDEDTQYFPSLQDIHDSLIKAQMRIIDQKRKKWSEATRFHGLKQTYQDNWEMLFKLALLNIPLQKPLTVSILQDPNHQVTKHLLYLYSMETFIYSDLNKACREKDPNSIQYYGAFASALSYIIHSAN